MGPLSRFSPARQCRSRRAVPVGGRVVISQSGEPVSDFSPCPIGARSFADVGAQPAEFTDVYEHLEACTGTHVPSVGGCEGIKILLSVAVEPAAHVVRLDQVPLARAMGDVVPVAEHGLAIADPDEIIGVGISVDQPRGEHADQFRPGGADLIDSGEQP
ncbi:hypothetical protein ETD96_35920 [Actinomadura geliboluensis]|uniref:Uncharacterized protein n=1 Tax=Actinomadura geliboluensis TaxID=882440 RepID=A0A5S4G8C7_9ACTN|nr:hypothetical protein ETD96_35920 [Actinomadura geliboluensis]